MIKVCLCSAVFLVSCLTSFGEISEKEMKRLTKSVEIAGVGDSTWKNEDREKFEVLEINTFQSQDDTMGFRIRIAVELTDKDKKKYLVKFTGNAPEGYDSEYEGEDYWNLFMPHGELERLKVSAYAIQYGIMDGDTFVPLAEKEDNSDSLHKGLVAGTTQLFPGTFYLKHRYMYEDSVDGSTDSVPSKVRAVKE